MVNKYFIFAIKFISILFLVNCTGKKFEMKNNLPNSNPQNNTFDTNGDNGNNGDNTNNNTNSNSNSSTETNTNTNTTPILNGGETFQQEDKISLYLHSNFYDPEAGAEELVFLKPNSQNIIDFGKVNHLIKTSNHTISFVLKNSSSKTVTIISTELPQGFSLLNSIANSQILNNSQIQFKIMLNSSELGEYSGKLKIKTNLIELSELVYDIKGVVK